MTQIRGRLFDLEDIKDPLTLFAALALVLEVGLGAIVLAAPNQLVQLLAVGGMIGVVALMVVVVGRHLDRASASEGVTPNGESAATHTGLEPPWQLNTRSLEPAEIAACEGVWRCRWSVRTGAGEFEKYVNDTVRIHDVDPVTGDITGFGEPVYEDSPGYELRGRISETGLAYLYYTTEGLHKEKAGFVILQFYLQDGEAEGWWLGGGRGTRRPPVGGIVSWTADENLSGEWTNEAFGDLE